MTLFTLAYLEEVDTDVLHILREEDSWNRMEGGWGKKKAKTETEDIRGESNYTQSNSPKPQIHLLM